MVPSLRGFGDSGDHSYNTLIETLIEPPEGTLEGIVPSLRVVSGDSRDLHIPYKSLKGAP